MRLFDCNATMRHTMLLTATSPQVIGTAPFSFDKHMHSPSMTSALPPFAPARRRKLRKLFVSVENNSPLKWQQRIDVDRSLSAPSPRRTQSQRPEKNRARAAIRLHGQPRGHERRAIRVDARWDNVGWIRVSGSAARTGHSRSSKVSKSGGAPGFCARRFYTFGLRSIFQEDAVAGG